MVEKKKTRKRSRKIVQKPFCSIPIRVPVLSSSSSKTSTKAHEKPGTNFYEWANESWLKEAKIPADEADYGVSEEVESCINTKSLEILKSLPETHPLTPLVHSCLHSAVQQTNVDLLKNCLAQLQCIESKEDVVREIAKLAKYQKSCIFQLDTFVDEEKRVHLELYPNPVGLKRVFYSDIEMMRHYKAFLNRAGNLFDIEKLESVISFEKTLLDASEKFWRNEDIRMKGSVLLKKYPKVPWTMFFGTLGFDHWKSHSIYVPAPSFFRWFGVLLDRVPISFWKLFFAKVYIVETLQYLPPPHDEVSFDFFDKILYGKTVKKSQSDLLLHIVYNRCSDIFSKDFWTIAGDEQLLEESKEFSTNLLKAAKARVSHIDWMRSSTRSAAVEKIDNMMFSFIRPDHWATTRPLHLDSKCLLQNIFTLGEWNTQNLFDRLDKPYRFWEEGIFRVNAYYYNSKNQIMIPYATVIAPFYSQDAPLGWNYGALGSIIGHEMCHGFDEDGRLYWKNGKKKNWWTHADRLAYRKKTEALVNLYSEETVLGKSVNGKLTLDENIADVGGLGIALEALKTHMNQKGIKDEETRVKAYQTFFCAFAASWRTKVRKEKLRYALKTDKHSPAFVRVNMVVKQFQEWYEAFDITEGVPMYLDESKRIRIF